MAKEESVTLSSYTISEEKETEDDTYQNELVPVICCMILLLFIVTIVLLIMVLRGYNDAERGESKSTFTLICVFEYLRNTLKNTTPQCTHYVYIRFFVYSRPVNQEPLVFEHKKRTDGSVNFYYEDNSEVWATFGSYRDIDFSVKMSMTVFNDSRWFLGMWGATYMRLMEGLWDAKILRDALHDTLRSTFSEHLTMDDFNGFAIINSIVRDIRPRCRAHPYSNVFRGNICGDPILPLNWSFIHTAAIWPGGKSLFPDSMVIDILKEADVVGISTSNSTDEPNILMERGGGYNVPYLAASPPNPLYAPGLGTRGSLDILREFPHWKSVLNRTKLCFSVTSAINYVYSSVGKIDFVRPMRNMEHVQRYSRLRFVTENYNGKYPVEILNASYHFDNTTYTHFWQYVYNNELLRFFAYDTGQTLQHKVTQMLKTYGDDKCVVFDDLGDDSHSVNITASCRTIAFAEFELLGAVRAALQNT